MCNRCNEDPRDNIIDAERALAGLSIMLSELGDNSQVRAADVAPILSLIIDRMDGAAIAIQGYVPRV